MLYPSIDSLMEKLDSKYTLVTVSAKRARIIQDTNKHMVDNPKSSKYVGIALEEILDEKLTYDLNKQQED